MEWQTALAKVNTTRLSAVAQADLKTLRDDGRDEPQLRSTPSNAELNRVRRVVPFAPTLVQVIEARLRFKFDDRDRDWQKTAGILTQVTREIGAVRAKLEAGCRAGASTPRVGRSARHCAAPRPPTRCGRT